MKNYKTNYLSIVAALFLMQFISAQISDGQEDDQMLNVEDKLISVDQLQALNPLNSEAPLPDAVNSVFIQQIGVNNAVFVNANSGSSDIVINQQGQDNLIDIDETSREAEKVISQIGNGNTIIDFSVAPEISTQLELLQEGNDLYFEKFGTNELSKNIKFTMTGNSRSIIIRSF